jgi:hypothetical protein
MKTIAENLRVGTIYCRNNHVKFRRVVIWCLSFFAATGIKTHGQETSFPTNSIPDTSTNVVTPSEVVDTNQVSQSQIQPQPQSRPMPSPQSSSGVMAWPGGQTTASPNQSSGVMAWPSAGAVGQTNSTGGIMAWPSGQTPAAPNKPSSTSAQGVMAWPSGQTPAEPSKPATTTTEGVMTWPAQAAPATANPPVTAPEPTPAPVVPAAVQPAPVPTAPVTPATVTPAPVVTPPASVPAPVEQPAPAVTAQVPPAPEQPAAASTNEMAAPAEGFSMTPPPMLQPPKSTKNEISVSGDFMFGDGQVSLPLGYSLNKALGGTTPSEQGAFTVPRNSTYYGGTLSYSYGQAWFIDASIAHGNSSGSQSIPTGFLGDINSTFSIDDTWYQLYLKYTFPQLRGKRFSAYLRGGISYVDATLNDNSTAGDYTQKDNTEDILGNIGAGLAYSLYTTHKLRIDLQGEIEGFGGERHQESTESLPFRDLQGPQVSIDNTLYGGIGIATIHGEYRMGKSGLFKIFGEVGVEGRYDIVDYSGSSSSSPSEYLWGPYIKLGLRYDF